MEWLTVIQAAQALGKSERTVRRWVEIDKIPHKQGATGIVVDISEYQQAAPDNAPPPDVIIENERLKAENELLRSERDFLRQALAASMDTTQKLIVAGPTDDDTEGQQAAPDTTPPRPWYRFW